MVDSSVVLFLGFISALILTYLLTKALQSWFARYDSSGISATRWNDRMFYTVWVLLLGLVIYGFPHLVMSEKYSHGVNIFKKAREAWN